MAIPTYKASGVFAASTASITPQYPTGGSAPVADDIAILAVESENEAIAFNDAQGFVEIGAQANKATGVTRLAVFWKRCVGGDTAPNVADPGDHLTGQIHLFSGCIASGDPWNVFAEGIDATSDTSGSIPGATTTVADCLVVLLCSSSRNATSTTEFSGWTNADLANLTERADNTNTQGGGGGHGMATGEKATAGAYGATDVTLANASVKGMMSIALKPPAAGGAFSVDAQPGTYTLTGATAGVPAARLIAANAGAYSLTGVAASVPAGRAINAAPGTYALTGVVAGVIAARNLNASPGTYAITGAAAGVLAGRIVSAIPGAYVITGFAAELALQGQFALDANPGAYTLTGSPAGVVASRLLVTSAGSYAITGTDAGLLMTRLLAALPGSYLVTGSEANLVYGVPEAIVWPDAVAPHFGENTVGRIHSPERLAPR